MNPRPKIAIVILNWNGRKFLEQFLPSVMATTYPAYELIVADNGSADDSLAFLEKNFPSVKTIRFEKNHGFAKGYNLALQEVRADYYMILNSDVEVTPGWLEPMAELLESDPQIAACQPKILSYSNKNMFDYAGAAGGWLDQYGYPFARGRVFDICEEDHGQYDTTGPVFWASGAALFIRAAVFHDMHGFDEYFFAHQEEIDLCWRMQLAGHKIYCCTSSVVYHVGGGTLPKGNSLKTFLNFRNNRIMLSKNLSFGKKLWVMPFRLFFDTVSAWKSLLSGDGGYFVAVWKAEIAFIGWWLFHKKRSVFPTRRKGLLQGWLNRNIAWQHFIKKKNSFSAIVGKSGADK